MSLQKKEVVDGMVETYKTRILMKNYSEKPSFDYEKTLLVVMLTRKKMVF